MKNIGLIAKSIGIKKTELELFGNYKAKVSLDILSRLKHKKDGKYVLVSAMTPTPQGEGKTVTTIGLSMALNKLKKSSIVTLRQPSLGPVFGIKGGGAGGGNSRIVPLEDVNLHLTGDAHAVGVAHNLLSAVLDNSIYHGNPLNIDINSIDWPRVIDISDRALKNIKIKYANFSRDTRFDITAASEVMAILALSSGIEDLKKRLGKIVVGFTKDGLPVHAGDLKIAGAMAVLLKDAIKPNLLQTIEGTPCFIHAGPFANIAHGNSSILADKIGIKLCNYLVTESGFGADMGAEKFFDIKCRESRMKPDCVVLVASLKALKNHSGEMPILPGVAASKNIFKENIGALKKGSHNLIKQIENIKKFGINVIVSINRFKSDTNKELDLVKGIAIDAGATGAFVSDFWNSGSKGGVELAKAVCNVSEEGLGNKFKFLYPLEDTIKDKIKKIAAEMYGASEILYSEKALNKIAHFEKLGWGKLPICMAKTQLSLSADPSLKGRPANFKIEVRDISPNIGAGFLVPICGNISTMPGLPGRPLAEKIDIDKSGNIRGIF